jgi:hypothetical protein
MGGAQGARLEVRRTKAAEEAAWQEKCFLFDDLFFLCLVLFVLLVVGVVLLLRRAALLRRGLVLSPP